MGLPIVVQLMNGNRIIYSPLIPGDNSYVVKVEELTHALMRIKEIKVIRCTNNQYVEYANRQTTFIILCTIYKHCTGIHLFRYIGDFPTPDEVQAYLKSLSYKDCLEMVQFLENVAVLSPEVFEQPQMEINKYLFNADDSQVVPFSQWVATLSCSLQDDEDLATVCRRIKGEQLTYMFQELHEKITCHSPNTPAQPNEKVKRKPQQYKTVKGNEAMLKQLLEEEEKEKARKKQIELHHQKKVQKKKKIRKPKNSVMKQRQEEKVEEEITESYHSEEKPQEPVFDPRTWLNERFVKAAEDQNAVFYSGN